MGIFRLLGAVVVVRQGPFDQFIRAVRPALNALMIGMLAIIAAAAIVFAIWVGFRLAKAEDEGKRKEAKQQLMWSIIAVVVTVAMFMVLQLVFNRNIFPASDLGAGSGAVGDAAAQVISGINFAIVALLQLGAIAAMVFAIYVGTRLAMAPDEGKRKEAKQQLLWTLIAIVGAIALSMIITSIMSILIRELNAANPPADGRIGLSFFIKSIATFLVF